MKYLILLLFYLIPFSVQAKCITHYVQPGETLFIISKKFLSDGKRWKEIKNHNHIRGTTIHVGQPIEIFEPTKNDWKDHCNTLIKKRFHTLNLDTSKQFIPAVVNSIENVEKFYSIEFTPKKKLEICKWVVTTAERESHYQFEIGGAGEVGIFQFKLDTFKYAFDKFIKNKDNFVELLKRHTKIVPIDLPFLQMGDSFPIQSKSLRVLEEMILSIKRNKATKNIVSKFMNNEFSIFVYIVYFNSLYYMCSRSLKCSFRVYNGAGDHAEEYSRKSIELYREISRINMCGGT